jgi:uncharacterized membrane protein
MKKLLMIAVFLPLSLSGCIVTTAVATLGTAVVMGVDAYCTGLSEDARKGVRDYLTNGKQILCKEGE